MQGAVRDAAFAVPGAAAVDTTGCVCGDQLDFGAAVDVRVGVGVFAGSEGLEAGIADGGRGEVYCDGVDLDGVGGR